MSVFWDGFLTGAALATAGTYFVTQRLTEARRAWHDGAKAWNHRAAYRERD